jgi:hypothetical protein
VGDRDAAARDADDDRAVALRELEHRREVSPRVLSIRESHALAPSRVRSVSA